MQIIISNEGEDMFELFEQFFIQRCHVVGCQKEPVVIVIGLAATVPACGLCATHFEQATEHPTELALEFDAYNAFTDGTNFESFPLRVQ